MANATIVEEHEVPVQVVVLEPVVVQEQVVVPVVDEWALSGL